MQSGDTSRRAVFFLITLFATFYIPAIASAQTCPQPGEVPITASTREAATAAGIPSTSSCWNPSNKDAGADAGEAKKYLRTILCKADGDNYGGMGPDGTIQNLSGKFAVCAAKFLKKANDAGMQACIREGARTVAKQEQYVRSGVIACKKGAMCEHPRGLAIDVNTSSDDNYKKLHQMAPGDGLTFYLGMRDKYHFVGSAGGCAGGGTTPQDWDFPQYAAKQPPSSAMSNAIRNALGIQPPPPPPIPPSPQIPQPQQSAQQQGVQSAFGGGGASGGSSSGGGTSQPTPVSQIFSPANPSSQLNFPQQAATSSTGTSTLDLLNQFLNPFSATSTEIGTSTPVSLLLGTIRDVAVVNSNSPPTATSSSGSVNASGTIVSMQPITAQQTFTSQDLQYTATRTNAPTTLTWRVLENMKQILLRALEYLKPFGGFEIRA